MTDYRVYIFKISNLNDGVTNCLEFTKWNECIFNDSTVNLKLDFNYPFYKEGITNPLVLKKILAFIKDKAERINIVESKEGDHSFVLDVHSKINGSRSFAKKPALILDCSVQLTEN